MTKSNRHKVIKEIIKSHEIKSQEELLSRLTDNHVEITQATLSRDIKELKMIKTPMSDGTYAYRMHDTIAQKEVFNDTSPTTLPASFNFTSIGFSGQLVVVKTRPGYAMGIASEIDEKVKNTVLGTVAGDDTILIIPIEGISRTQLIDSLSDFIPQQLKQTIN